MTQCAKCCPVLGPKYPLAGGPDLLDSLGHQLSSYGRRAEHLALRIFGSLPTECSVFVTDVSRPGTIMAFGWLTVRPLVYVAASPPRPLDWSRRDFEGDAAPWTG